MGIAMALPWPAGLVNPAAHWPRGGPGSPWTWGPGLSDFFSSGLAMQKGLFNVLKYHSLFSLLFLHTHVSLYYLKASVFYLNVWSIWVLPQCVVWAPGLTFSIWPSNYLQTTHFGKKKKKKSTFHTDLWSCLSHGITFQTQLGLFLIFFWSRFGLSVYSCANTKLLITGIIRVCWWWGTLPPYGFFWVLLACFAFFCS